MFPSRFETQGDLIQLNEWRYSQLKQTFGNQAPTTIRAEEKLNAIEKLCNSTDTD